MIKAKKISKKLNKKLTEIAIKELDLQTLEEQKSDEFDFHVLGVWDIKRALLAAYEAGKKEALS
jgi:hypothetical protein